MNRRTAVHAEMVFLLGGTPDVTSRAVRYCQGEMSRIKARSTKGRTRPLHCVRLVRVTILSKIEVLSSAFI